MRRNGETAPALRPDDSSPFQIVAATDLPDDTGETPWLVQGLWLADAVGLIGAAPKRCKTWLALDIAVSVATGTPCLGQFEVGRRGRVLLYCAEDSLAALKARVRSICESRGLGLESLDIAFIADARIDLNDARHCRRLEEAVRRYGPVLVVLDPFVRIFSGNEDDSSQVSRVLGFLRAVQREHHVAVAVVHHNSKRSEGSGQALRGSGDFYAWMDSGIFLSRTEAGLIRLATEHRSAASPDLIHLRLVTEPLAHLEVVEHDDAVACDAPRDLDAEVLAALEPPAGPLNRSQLRTALKVNNSRLGEALVRLSASGAIVLVDRKWAVPGRSVPAVPLKVGPEQNAELR